MSSRTLRKFCLCALMGALSAAGSLLRIPFFPVPLTLQFFFALMAGLTLGKSWGALSQLMYLLAGLAGLPVFAGGGGPGYVLQPTFGFLLGLIPAAWCAGQLSGAGRGCAAITAMAGAWACLYAVGLPWLHFSLILAGTQQSLWQSALQGCILFLPADGMKMLFLYFLYPRLRRALKFV